MSGLCVPFAVSQPHREKLKRFEEIFMIRSTMKGRNEQFKLISGQTCVIYRAVCVCKARKAAFILVVKLCVWW